MSIFVIFDEALQFTADHSKYLFLKNPRNDGKIYMGAVVSVVRHPNFLGFFLWRLAFTVACGELVWGCRDNRHVRQLVRANQCTWSGR
jgi:steroid 5-alpha reductase family enzyme